MKPIKRRWFAKNSVFIRHYFVSQLHSDSPKAIWRYLHIASEHHLGRQRNSGRFFQWWTPIRTIKCWMAYL